MAPPRKQAGRGRTRRRVKKNIAIGQAHIKTSFNNTIVALTDKEGNVFLRQVPMLLLLLLMQNSISDARKNGLRKHICGPCGRLWLI